MNQFSKFVLLVFISYPFAANMHSFGMKNYFWAHLNIYLFVILIVINKFKPILSYLISYLTGSRSKQPFAFIKNKSQYLFFNLIANTYNHKITWMVVRYIGYFYYFFLSGNHTQTDKYWPFRCEFSFTLIWYMSSLFGPVFSQQFLECLTLVPRYTGWQLIKGDEYRRFMKLWMRKLVFRDENNCKLFLKECYEMIRFKYILWNNLKAKFSYR